MSHWTDERVATLKQRWLQGWSASQIAKELGGVSRNGVIGKIYRLGMAESGRARAAAPARLPPAPRPIKPPKPTAKVLPFKPPAPLPPVQEISDEHLAHHPRLTELRRAVCHWPLGLATGADQRFCGCPTSAEEDVYCAGHQLLNRSAKGQSSPKDFERGLRRYVG